MPPGMVINPVAWKWAGADHFVVRRPVGTDGKGEMTNYRVRQQTYIIDRLTASLR